jgi:hypothetical protein
MIHTGKKQYASVKHENANAAHPGVGMCTNT